MGLIAAAVPFFLTAIAVEWLWGRWKGRDTYRLNDAVSSLTLGGLSQARGFVALGAGGSIYAWLSTVTPFQQWSMTGWQGWILAFVLYDLCYYLSHRAGHEVTLFWAAHVVHHQSEDYNLSTALRQTSSGFLFGWIFYTPLFLIGIPAEVVVTVGALNLIYQFWVHTEHVGELGWFEYIFVSPSNHRVHHARNPRYLDRNYGGVFIIWDRLFGTYQRELPEETCIYGITRPIDSWSPLESWLHVYRDTFRDMWRTNSWLDRAWAPFSHPSWRPRDLGDDASANKAQDGATSQTKFDPQISLGRKASATANLFAITLLLVVAQQNISGVLDARLNWGMMLWLGIANARLMSGSDGPWFKVQEVVKAAVLALLVAPLSGAFAIVGIALALLSVAWLFLRDGLIRR